jgi:hypothetical protein
MPVSDLDIARSARQWIELHRENATAKAREMVEAMRAEGRQGRRRHLAADHRGDRDARRGADRRATLNYDEP